MHKNGSLDNPMEMYDRTSQSGSLSVEDENSDITIENELGTENTEDYEDDNFSALSETIETDETQSVQSGCSGCGGIISENGPTPEARTDFNTAVHSSVTTGATMQRSSSTTSAPPLAMRSSSTSAVRSTSMAYNLNQQQRQQLMSASSSVSSGVDRNQNLQNAAAAAVYNYHVISTEIGHEYLNDIYTEEDEKVYEDLCYVTFSSKVSEVCRPPLTFCLLISARLSMHPEKKRLSISRCPLKDVR